MDITILEDLGLTQAETKVYIALLELGSSSAGHIIEKAGIQNSVTHRALNSLIEKGLISYISEGKKKVYQATNPENFHDFIDDKRKRFDKILPELKKKQGVSKTDSIGEIFKGKRGVIQLYMTLLNSKGKEYNTFGGGSEGALKTMGEDWWRNLHIRKLAKKLPSRQVFDESIKKFGEELNKKKMSDIRFLPKEYAQLQETIIIGDYVGIAIFKDSPYGILIKDSALADAYRQQFEILWKKAKR
mgnify:CR=1 FL=1